MNTVINGDSDTSLRDEVLLDFPEVAAFGTWKTPPIHSVRGVLVWDKGPAFGMGDLSFPWKPSWELIYIRGDEWSGKRDEGVLRGDVVVSWESKGRVHPHEKPVWILSHLISKHTPGMILDPFMGSGTTCRAAKDLQRKSIGIEIEEKYCEIAAKRLAQEVLPL
jgi:site-specific DNA-methyltransferase (adenine-specific)